MSHELKRLKKLKKSAAGWIQAMH